MSTQSIITTFESSTRDLFSKRNLFWTRVGWDDCSRALHSSIGPNISDWSFQLKDGTVLPFLRSPNFTDKTATLRSRDIAVVVGNETKEGNLQTITLEQYLKNYGRYTPGVPDEVDLSNGLNELISIRFIAVIVPENRDGSQEVVPVAYNYQTTDKKDPKNIIAASFHMGVGSQTDGPGQERVYLVKTKDDDSHENTWFCITNEHRESREQKKSVSSVLGTRSTGCGRNRVQCIQIPRVQTHCGRNRNFNESCSLESMDSCETMIPKSIYRSLNMGNVSYGSNAGRHVMDGSIRYTRDKTQSITITFAYYFTTADGNISETDAESIADTLDISYQDTQAQWIGSLVTETVDPLFEKKEPGSSTVGIQLPVLTKDDVSTFQHKVTHFPKSKEHVQQFPI